MFPESEMFPTVSLSPRPGPGTGPGSSIIIAAAALVVVVVVGSFLLLLLCEEQDHPVRAVTHCQRPPTITPFGCNCHPALTLP